ncbi:MAG: sulfurtransferase [Acidobacteria bacterium]|nr:sulfurtransferase [Acidobacteriota bacterium]
MILAGIALCSLLHAQGAPPSAGSTVPKEMQTSLGLYLTPAEAFEKWKADAEHVKILDVRTPDEYLFVGHPTMAWNIPLALQSYAWDSSGKKLPMKPNPEFLKQATATFKPSDTLLVICRSGGRSAKAVDALAAAGYKQVYNIVEGVEGDLVDDPASPNHGKRLKNGWKNAGLPWTYDLDPAKMRLPIAEPTPKP